MYDLKNKKIKKKYIVALTKIENENEILLFELVSFIHFFTIM